MRNVLKNRSIKVIRIILVLLILNTESSGQVYLGLDENHLLRGAPYLPLLKPIAGNELPGIVDEIKKLGIQYKYIIGSCEDRAHFLVKFLKSKGYYAGKIWNFAPSRYTLISTKNLQADDPLGLKDKINWGYHVAPIITVENNRKLDTLAIDFSFDANPITYMTWLKKMNCNESLYIFTDSDSYLFSSINGLTVYDNINYPNSNNVPSVTLPSFLPAIITGDFWMYNASNTFVEEGLAANDIAVYACEKYIKTKSADADSVTVILLNENNINSFISGASPAQVSANCAKDLLEYYGNRKAHWKAEFDKVKNK